MERTKYYFPDAMYSGHIKQEYTQIPNELLKDNTLSAKAKIILCVLLSNRKGWKSYVTGLQSFLKEGKDSIDHGLRELEQHGYLLRCVVRKQDNKIRVGSFWAYTDIPLRFDIKEQIMGLCERNLETLIKCPQLGFPDMGFPDMGFPDMGFPDMENPQLIILNNNNTNYKKTNYKNTKPRHEENDKNDLQEFETEKSTIEKKNETFLPLARYLAKIIKTYKNINYPLSQIKSWANEIRLLSSQNNIEISRIKSALKWYEIHVGEQYVPIIECGQSLRNKFSKLENAIQREKNPVKTKPNITGHRDKNYKYRQPDMEV